MSNIVSRRQIRAARMLAGLTQADLARAAGCHPRSVRYWENKGSNEPTNVAPTLDSIEQALNRHGIILFSAPTPGVRVFVVAGRGHGEKNIRDLLLTINLKTAKELGLTAEMSPDRQTKRPIIAGKRLELSREFIPGLRHVAILANISSPHWGTADGRGSGSGAHARARGH